jgi:hypothetical protein
MGFPTYVTEKKVAEIMGYAVQTLRNQRFLGTGPTYIKLDRAIRYSLEDVFNYMEQHKVLPKGQR